MAKKKPKRSKGPPRVNRWARQAEWRSGFEKAIRADLTKRKVPYEYEPTAFPIWIPGSPGHYCAECSSRQTRRATRYTPDFWLSKADLYVEAKGKLDARSKRALLAFRDQYPGHRLAVLFQRDNWTTKTKKEKYTDWARRNKIAAAVGDSIPGEWLK